MPPSRGAELVSDTAPMEDIVSGASERRGIGHLTNAPSPSTPLVPHPTPPHPTFNISRTQVDIELTPEGLANRFDVVAALFSYLNLVREQGVPAFLYPEQRALSDLGWRFQDKQAPSSLVPILASSLQEYEPERVLR